MPRLILPGLGVHIIQRGNNRVACFRDESDYLVYLLHLKDLAAKTGCLVHAYCLMGNHVHLLVTPSSPEGCMSLMRDLGQRYVQYFNRNHARTGTLWEGRFRSCVTESARYVLACYRYIELNPVRAGMVMKPGDYRWSSHAANVGLRTESLITAHPDFTASGGSTQYARLFDDEIPSNILDNIRAAVTGGYPLGSESFKQAIAASGSRRLERGKAGRPAKSARMR
jgi:putative transposase